LIKIILATILSLSLAGCSTVVNRVESAPAMTVKPTVDEFINLPAPNGGKMVVAV
jgi:uncharacterized protein YceK